jgi:hypothetical protein
VKDAARRKALVSSKGKKRNHLRLPRLVSCQCGGSEVRIDFAASWICGLLNQAALDLKIS